MPRIVVLGTGTEVGKSYVAQRLITALRRACPSLDVVGVKPVETGIPRAVSRQSRARSSAALRDAPSKGAPPPRTDALALESVSRGTAPRPHPLFAFRDPVSPHLAARREGRSIRLRQIAHYVTAHDAAIRGWQVVETAGGAFSPLGRRATNVDLARALDPSIWVVVAPDGLGVLHDVRATLLAMHAAGRDPDYLVLSAARSHDASFGTNAAELPRVGLPRPDAVLGPDDDGRTALTPLVRKLLRAARAH